MENTHAEQEESWYLLKELLNGRKAFNQFLGLCIYPRRAGDTNVKMQVSRGLGGYLISWCS